MGNIPILDKSLNSRSFGIKFDIDRFFIVTIAMVKPEISDKSILTPFMTSQTPDFTAKRALNSRKYIKKAIQ